MMLSAARRAFSSAAVSPAAPVLGASLPAFEGLALSTPAPGVLTVALDRPSRANAMNPAMWASLKSAFEFAGSDPHFRAVILTGGSSRNFTAGLDLEAHASLLTPAPAADGTPADPSRRGWALYQLIQHYQACISALEKCHLPVIAAVHGACIGGGVDLVSAADIRYAANDAVFSIKEVDLGLAADVGTLQRLPRLGVSESLVRELAFTARRWPAHEAAAAGFVSRLALDKDSLLAAALDTAKTIASKSPLAVAGTKMHLVASRDLPVEQGLQLMAAWNAGMLQTHDVPIAAGAGMSRTVPVFADLPKGPK